MKIQDYFLTVQMECDCGCSFILVGQVGQERPCPDCPRFVRLDGFSWDEEAKQIRLKLSWGKDESTEVPVNVTDFIPETAPETPGTIGAALGLDESILDVE